MVELRPLELGELVDRAFTLWRAHWRKLFPLVFGFNLALYAVGKAVVLFQQQNFPALYGGSKAMTEALKNDPSGTWPQLVGAMASTSLLMVVWLWISWVSGVAVTRWLHPVVVGAETPSLSEAARYSFQRFGRTTLAWFLALLWTAGVSLLLMLPGVLAMGLGAFVSGSESSASRFAALALILIGSLLTMLGLLGAILWSIVRFALIPQVLALEDKDAWASLRRGGELTRGQIKPGLGGNVKLRLAVLITVVGVLLLLIAQLSAAPIWVLHSIYGGPFDFQNLKLHLIPAYAMVPAELFQNAVTSIVAPVSVALQVLFYVDMRVRREGLDLQLKLATAPAETKAVT